MIEIKAKDFDGYNGTRDDYANGQELMTTITLAEYRDLVSFKAKHEDENRKLRLEGYEKDKQIADLKKKVEVLTDLINGRDGSE